MKLARLLNAAWSWRDVVRERLLKLRPPHRSPYPPSWPLDSDRLRRLVIHWPTKYLSPDAATWGVHLLEPLRDLVRVEPADLPQSHEGLIVIRAVLDGRVHDVAIDYRDYPDRIDRSAVERCLVTFKMQFLSAGYGDDRIVPGGYVNASADYYRYLPSLRRLRDGRPPLFDVYGRFSLHFATEVRSRAVALLSEQRHFRYEGSLKLVRHSRSLREAARSRLLIDLPGNGPFCFRLVDYLGVGGCVVARRHAATLPMPLRDREHIVFVRDDLEDLVEVCRHYLEHDEERERIALNSRDYFDRYLHRDQLAAYYLHEVLKRIDG
jgi:hypothetical protein